ncbi:hypothetical protein MPTK1_2g02710 [Marchantia polymorpha subsp. ruderalis]|uniref:PsbP C-terminal domain-containing protein n=1 Tax=Marchantia polymorpha TaxID=3197 RepID=A0A2R6WM34_MARPO|nr:hypothetical protein MARPO_0075s0034 [Marchantia polymorpha]BBN00856.1 hypothetical protein Mp_2g02710 [Marchantia polymorpha subsp. ruderalis]|eukprot:PTQ34911.1 hypothetical protein MARPO_0075s0034 [Marchantia polymorpha]
MAATATAMSMSVACTGSSGISSRAAAQSGRSTGVAGLLNLAICRQNLGRVSFGCRAQSSSMGTAGESASALAAAVGKVRGWRSTLDSLRDNERVSMVNSLEDLSLESVADKLEVVTSAMIAGALVLFFMLAGPCRASAAEAADFTLYYGTAASASSYGGYGGNTNKRDSAEYTFEFPTGWKERTISKIEKGTNGTDSEFLNPKHKEEKVYVTYLSGFRRLAPMDNVLNNLALSDPVLQDILQLADGNITAKDRTDASGQLYYDYEIDSPVAHALISVTCAKNKLYAHFVKAGNSDWTRDQELLRHVHESFSTIGDVPLAPPGEF